MFAILKDRVDAIFYPLLFQKYWPDKSDIRLYIDWATLSWLWFTKLWCGRLRKKMEFLSKCCTFVQQCNRKKADVLGLKLCLYHFDCQKIWQKCKMAFVLLHFYTLNMSLVGVSTWNANEAEILTLMKVFKGRFDKSPKCKLFFLESLTDWNGLNSSSVSVLKLKYCCFQNSLFLLVDSSVMLQLYTFFIIAHCTPYFQYFKLVK